jgi:CheY-like chemotaxis protein
MPGGGRLEIRLGSTDLIDGDPRLPLEPEVRPGLYAELAVRDDGTGMDARTLEHLFEPFFTTKPVGEGTGLGLSTAYGIIRQSGGYLGVRSAPGRGTEFTILLPLTTEPVRRPDQPESAAPVGGRETVLLVEDELEVRRMAARSLRAEGYSVLEAADGQEALRMMADRSFEVALVLTDLAMPRLDGLDLSSELSRIAPRIPVLFMTGYTSSEAMRRGALRRGYPLIEKPFTPEDLAARVRAALDQAAGVPAPG